MQCLTRKWIHIVSGIQSYQRIKTSQKPGKKLKCGPLLCSWNPFPILYFSYYPFYSVQKLLQSPTLLLKPQLDMMVCLTQSRSSLSHLVKGKNKTKQNKNPCRCPLNNPFGFLNFSKVEQFTHQFTQTRTDCSVPFFALNGEDIWPCFTIAWNIEYLI